jgi:ApbE superfamily uncharacterized protein (UPF0280 family)
MPNRRIYQRFTHRDANFRICSDRVQVVQAEIRRQRGILEQYIVRHPEFATALKPLEPREDAPPVARRMASAAVAVGVGPMAAVAGTMAQLAVEAAWEAGATESIVENGGDIFLFSPSSVVIGLYAGDSPLIDRLALSLTPEKMPMALCSSSGRMGHSFSFGACDLATVASRDASLADAAATRAANLVKTQEDLDQVLERVGGIEGIDGVLLVKGDRIGLIGHLGELVPNRDVQLRVKVTRDEQ